MEIFIYKTVPKCRLITILIVFLLLFISILILLFKRQAKIIKKYQIHSIFMLFYHYLKIKGYYQQIKITFPYYFKLFMNSLIKLIEGNLKFIKYDIKAFNLLS